MSAASAASVVSRPIPRGASIASRLQLWLPWLVSALALVAAIHAIEPLPIGVFYDDAQYVILAKSMATGHGYRFLNLPGAPFGTHFPPGYPAFLAILWRISPAFPENVALMKFANAILLAVVALLSYRFAHRTLELPSGLAAATAVAGAATIPSLLLSSSIMSEPLFLAMLIPMLTWSERETSPHSSVRAAVLLGIAAGALTLVRTHGIALAAAIAVAYFVRRQRREAIVSTAAAVLLVAPWLFWVAAHNDALPPLVRGAYGSYFGWLVTGFRDQGLHLLIVTLPDNAATIWVSIVRSIVPDVHWSVDLLVGGLFAALTSIGAAVCWRRARVLTLFALFYFAIVLVWPFSPLRFVWGIWPLVMLFPAAGLAAAWKSAVLSKNVPQRAALIAAAVVLSVTITAFNVRGYENAWWSSNARYHARRVLPQLAWVARATHPTDVVASDAEASVYLYTGRLAVPITSFTAAEYARERTANEQTTIVDQLLQQYHPRYVLATSPQVVDAIARLAHSRPTAFVLIDSLMPGAVYEDRLARGLQ